MGSLHDAAIQRSEAFLRYLPPLSFCGIQFAPIPELACAVVLRNGSDSLLNVVAAELERLAIPGPASQGDMDMRMLRVVVNYGDPFQLGTSVLLNSLQHIAGQPLEASMRSPNSGENISFQRRSSPAACHSPRRPAMSMPFSSPFEPAVFCSCSMVALARAT